MNDQEFANLNGIVAILLWILSAIMYGDGGVVAWLAIVPLLLGIVGMGAAQFYHRRASER